MLRFFQVKSISEMIIVSFPRETDVFPSSCLLQNILGPIIQISSNLGMVGKSGLPVNDQILVHVIYCQVNKRGDAEGHKCGNSCGSDPNLSNSQVLYMDFCHLELNLGISTKV